MQPKTRSTTSRSNKISNSRKTRPDSPEPESSDNGDSIISTSPSMSAPIRVLVCSIGNPGPYLSTLHSVGHTVINSLATRLSYPSFHKSRSYGNGIISQGTEYTLYQSPTLMNVSGPAVASAWNQFLKDRVGAGEVGKLVVLHDELESPLGHVKVRPGDASAKGHNGLKSINKSLGPRGVEYTRIGVGIGRPESRDSAVVADFVLRKMTVVEKKAIEGCTDDVERALHRLSTG